MAEPGNVNIKGCSVESTSRAENMDIPIPGGKERGEEGPQLTKYHERNSPEASVTKDGVQKSSSALYHVSSSLSRSTGLWPQTFGRQMEIYSRSPSGRIYGEFFEADNNGDRISSETLDTDSKDLLIYSQRNDSLKEPLLRSSSINATIKDKDSRVPVLKEYEPRSIVNESAAAREDELEVVGSEGSSFLQACLNGTNVLAGVGILSTPYALSQGGWLSLSFLLLFAVICLYTGIVLRKCMDTDPSIVTYPDIGQAAFGRKGRFLVSILLYFELYCVTVEFLIMEGDNLINLFPLADVVIGNSTISGHELYIIFSALCFLPTVWLRDLSLLSYISAGGVIALLAIVSVVGFVGAFEGVGFSHTGTLMNFSGLPVAVGIYAFCFCGHAVFPNIYRSMKHKEQFSKVLIVCFTAVTIMYGSIAIFGYTMFGENLESQVTLNLPSTAVSSRIAIWIILVNPFAKFALTITPIAVSLEEFLPWTPKSNQFLLGSFCIRSLLVFSTVIVAIAIPFFGLMMAFIGSFLSITVAVILPCLCYLRIYGRAGGISSAEVSVLNIIVFVGTITGFVGTYSAVRAILGNISDKM